jgi:predicted transcriptional regulator
MDIWYPIWQMVKTTVYLDHEVALKFRQLAEVKGRSQAELIREALANYALGDARLAIPGAGEFRSGRADTSERAKEILAKAASRGKWRRQGSKWR